MLFVRKTNRTAKFDCVEPRRYEDLKGIVALEIAWKVSVLFQIQSPGPSVSHLPVVIFKNTFWVVLINIILYTAPISFFLPRSWGMAFLMSLGLIICSFSAINIIVVIITFAPKTNLIWSRWRQGDTKTQFFTCSQSVELNDRATEEFTLFVASWFDFHSPWYSEIIDPNHVNLP